MATLTVHVANPPEADGDANPDGFTAGYVLGVLRAAGLRVEVVTSPSFPVAKPVHPQVGGGDIGQNIITGDVTSRPRLACDTCAREFATPQARSLHEQSHLEVSCPDCGGTVRGNAVGPHRRVCRGKPAPTPPPRPKPAPSAELIDQRRAAAAEAAYG